MFIRGPAIFTERAPPNQNVALVGDSITAFEGVSPFFWSNGIVGAPLRVVLNAGVGSERVNGTVARIDNAFTASPPGLAGLSTIGLGWVFLRIGTNDADIAIPLATVDGDYDTLIAKILGYATRLVIFAVPPLYSNSTYPREYNEYLATVCAANPTRMLFVDDCSELRTGPDTQIGSYFQDGVHPNGIGTLNMGRRAAANANLRAFLAGNVRFPLVTSAADVYPTTAQWVPNPVMAGTGGTVGTGFTGTVADSWTIHRYGEEGLATGTLSIVSADQGDINQTPWQRVAIINGGGSSSGIDAVTELVFGTISTTSPERGDVALELRFNALDTFAAFDFTLLVTNVVGDDVLFAGAKLACFNAGVVTERVILRFGFRRTDFNVDTDAKLTLHCTTYGNVASPGSYDFRCVSVRILQ